ncbi:MAG: hypothetical protein ACJA2W_002384 [Planctomycetota bacterium]|jgi:hypothetical protein
MFLQGRPALGLVALLISPLCAAQALGQAAAQVKVPTSSALDGVEALADSAKPWLKKLERWVAGKGAAPSLVEVDSDPSPGSANIELGGWFLPGSQSIVPVEVRGARVSRIPYEWSCEPGDAKEWRAAVLGERAGSSSIITHTKILSVSRDTVGPDRRPVVRMEVRLELEDGESPALWQIVSDFTVSFVVQEDGGLTASEVEIDRLERIGVDAPLLVERTKALFANEPEVAELLGVGMDRWALRLDDAGLTSWFGHQGLAVGDANGDGLDDLYVAMPSGLPNLLLVQQPDGTVRNMAEAMGVAWLDDTKGVLLIDVNGDGRDDVVSALGHVIVVQYSDGQGAFPIGGWCVAPDETPFYGISATDFDGDGDLDLFGARYVTSQYGESVPIPFHEARNGPTNHFFRNTERGFQDVTGPLGLGSEGGERFSLAGHFIDFDLDGDDDLYVVNDFGSNQLFEYAGGKFREVSASLGAADPGAGMGAAWSDYDADGDLDLYVTNMFSSAGRRVAFQSAFAEGRPESEREGIQRLSLGNTLLRRDEDGFTDVAEESNTRMGRWAWGATFVDLNGDGHDDLVSPSGFLTGPKPGDL